MSTDLFCKTSLNMLPQYLVCVDPIYQRPEKLATQLSHMSQWHPVVVSITRHAFINLWKASNWGQFEGKVCIDWDLGKQIGLLPR